jgi:predicted methyltransferase
MNLFTEKEVENIGKLEPQSLVLGDCLNVMRFIPDHSIDVVICDLPYG